MKSSIFFVLAALVGLFALAVGFDVINFATDRTDGRVVLLSIGAFVGLAALGFSGSSEPEDDDSTGRAAAAKRLSEGRLDPSELPSKPGSLLKKDPPAELLDLDCAAEEIATTPFVSEAIEAEELGATAAAFDEDQPSDDAPVADDAPDDEAPGDDAPARVLVAADAPSEASADPIEDELHSIIDDEQMLEITDLVAAAEAEVDEQDHFADDQALVPEADSVEPLKRLELRLADYDDDDLRRVVKESESVVIAEMVRNGQLSSEGELTQQDIASMVFLAYTSEEMLNELRLRKSMDAPGLDTPVDFVPLDTTD